jgi:hypothetical protein
MRPDRNTSSRSTIPNRSLAGSTASAHAAALSSLSAPRATIFNAPSGNGRWSDLASSRGARIHTPRSSSVVTRFARSRRPRPIFAGLSIVRAAAERRPVDRNGIHIRPKPSAPCELQSCLARARCFDHRSTAFRDTSRARLSPRVFFKSGRATISAWQSVPTIFFYGLFMDPEAPQERRLRALHPMSTVLRSGWANVQRWCRPLKAGCTGFS